MKPTIEEMLSAWREDSEAIDYVDNVLLGTWRHGTEYQFVGKRLSDNTLWAVDYRTDKDGDYNDFRDGGLGDSDVYPVERVEIIQVAYKAVK